MLGLMGNTEFDKWWNQWISRLLGEQAKVTEPTSEEKLGADAKLVGPQPQPMESRRDSQPERRD
jgi:hypothetical protein